jgi:SAM-dependent methyltransferase
VSPSTHPSEQYAEALAPVAACMLAEARIEAGERVLDVGSGDGDMALAAAGRTGPSGFVLATDVSLERMAGLAERRRGLRESHPILLQQSAAEALDLPAASFDVALARNCLMYVQDLGLALANIRAALRPGGRLIAAVYGPLEREPFHAIPIEAVLRRRTLVDPLPEYVQAFRIGAGELRSAVTAAGFTDARSHLVAVARSYPSLATAIAALRESRSLGALLSALPRGEREDAWAEIAERFRRYEGPAGLNIPGEQVVLVGHA